MPDGGDAPGGIGHNSKFVEIGENDFLGMVAQLRDVDDRISVLTAQRKKIRKEARGRGIRMTALDQALKFAEMERDEPKRHISNLFTYMKWLRYPLGHQGNLFDDEAEDGADPFEDDGEADDKRAVEEATYAGFNAGLKGDPKDQNPYPKEAAAHKAWADNWKTGDKARKHEMPPFSGDDD